jgi:hypothetical protein
METARLQNVVNFSILIFNWQTMDNVLTCVIIMVVYHCKKNLKDLTAVIMEYHSSVLCRVIFNMLLSALPPYKDEIIGDYQCGS